MDPATLAKANELDDELESLGYLAHSWEQHAEVLAGSPGDWGSEHRRLITDTLERVPQKKRLQLLSDLRRLLGDERDRLTQAFRDL